MGNAGVLLRAYVYARMLGREGMPRVAEFATLNANYLMARLREAGFQLAYPERRASHEFIVTLKREARELGVNRHGLRQAPARLRFHAPTTYFPLLVPECLLIEPTETESKEALDAFVEAMGRSSRRRARARGRGAPHTTPVRRLDDVRAARQLDVAWKPAAA
jgi:glycine dehydrogenase subunit 2